MTDKHIRDMTAKEVGEHLFPHRRKSFPAPQERPMTDDMPKDVERYDVFYDGTMLQRNDGDWVRYEDYAALSARLAEAEARNAALVEGMVNAVVEYANSANCNAAGHAFLVAEHLRALAKPEEHDALVERDASVRAKERERCAKIVEQFPNGTHIGDIAAAIKGDDND